MEASRDEQEKWSWSLDQDTRAPAALEDASCLLHCRHWSDSFVSRARWSTGPIRTRRSWKLDDQIGQDALVSDKYIV